MLKIAVLTLLICGLGLGVVQGRAALADLHIQKSHEFARHNPGSANALLAAGLATQLTPWRRDALTEFAWRLQTAGRTTDARSRFAKALSGAPADPYLWAEYAQLLAWQRKFGHEMESVTRRSNELGPTSNAIQRGNADIGVYFWPRGNSALQREWLRSMSFVLRNDRPAFLQWVVHAQRGLLFCLGPGAHLPVTDWCASQRLGE